MVGNEHARRHLREQLVASIGEEAAETLMDEMGSIGRDQLASRLDVQDGFANVKKRFEEVDKRFEQVDKRFEQVDKRFEQVDKRFRHLEGELTGLRADMNVGFEKLRTEMATQGSTFSLDIANQTRQLGIWILASQLTLAGSLIAAIRF